MSKIRLWLKVFDTKTGEVHVDRECNSWVLQFLPFLAQIFYCMPVTQYPDTGNTLRSLGAAQSLSYGCIGNVGVGTVTYGIVVGSGTGAEAATNYALGTLIAHGTSANQLSYGAGSFTEPAVAGTTSLFKVQRVVVNNSPTNPITVQEVGLYMRNGSGYTFCVARDLTGGIAIANAGGSKTIEFTVTVDNTS